MRRLFDFYGCLFALVATVCIGDAFAAQAPNPRVLANQSAANSRAGARVSGRGDANKSASVARTTTNRQVARGATKTNVAMGRGMAERATSATNNGRVATSGAMRSVARAAINPNKSGRTATMASDAGIARAAGVSRATAIFSDVTKIGGGYAACRESYATCMDQFCANLNDTYRRCYCSSRFTELRDTEAALDESKNLLLSFENNHLNAVGMTAEEVNAMYSATVGEMAIKSDASAAQSVLNEIGDLLAGRRKPSDRELEDEALGLMSVDFSADMDDIWSGGGGNSIFDEDTGVQITQLEGLALYNAAHKQCLELSTGECESDAVLAMTISAYDILIAQDCNVYQKKVDKQREQVKHTVREAEKYLREARLEEYRAHNSSDVNECVAKVKTAITTEFACGANYKMCLDYTGAYINPSTGEARYTARLFQLENLILLDGVSSDVLAQNPDFDKFLDGKRMFAESALDTCRDQADIVWNEFKRQALIEIAQAQDEKIEEIRTSCVKTMTECYDTQGGGLKKFDDTTAQQAGALAAYAARDMCREQVVACAALYSHGGKGCQFDGNGHLTSNAGECGLTALLDFVASVDDTRVAESCLVAMENDLIERCTPTRGDIGYPWDCRTMSRTGLEDSIRDFAQKNCAEPGTGELPDQVANKMNSLITDVTMELDILLMEQCEALDGYWLDVSEASRSENQGSTPLLAFYSNVYNGNTSIADTYGKCVENTLRISCANFNESDNDPVATYDSVRDECVFTDEWYASQCAAIGGYWDKSMCYIGLVQE